MKVLVFEWLNCGGLWIDQIVPNHIAPDEIAPDQFGSIQNQGWQMLNAIVTDLHQAGVEILVPVDSRLSLKFAPPTRLTQIPVSNAETLPTTIAELARDADYILVIAPETDSSLRECLGWINESLDKLISPNLSFVAITESKSATFEYLEANGFDDFPKLISPTCLNNPQLSPTSTPRPAVLKPDFGAGSEGVVFIPDLNSWNGDDIDWSAYRLEEFISGTPVSVSVIGNADRSECSAGAQILPPTIQVFDDTPFGNYVSAEFPIDPDIEKRATLLAKKVVAALPPTNGYFGMDMVISDRDASLDRLIEINPRLTMSYLKLREICPENLALKMLPIQSLNEQ